MNLIILIWLAVICVILFCFFVSVCGALLPVLIIIGFSSLVVATVYVFVKSLVEMIFRGIKNG